MVRLVADFHTLNKALERPIWTTESCDQIMRHINPDYTIFCTIDCTSAYNQVQINKDDKHLTSIVTQAGRYNYNTLLQVAVQTFGIC